MSQTMMMTIEEGINLQLAPFLAHIVAPALDYAADMAEARIEADLSTPWPPSSSRGSSPHLRTGELRDNVDHPKPTVAENSVAVSIVSARPSTPGVPAFLEFDLDRPYMRRELERLKGGEFVLDFGQFVTVRLRN